MKRIALVILLSFALLVVFAGCDGEEETVTAEDETADGPSRILVVHSYHPEYKWVADVNEGLEAELTDADLTEGEDYLLEYFYMDTKRIPAEEFEGAGADALAKIEELDADIVVTVDDNAQTYVSRELLDGERAVFFCGVNSDPVEKYGIVDSYDKPGHNITGCLERERFAGTLDLLREMRPEAAAVAFIYDDGTTAPPVIERMKAQAAELGLEVVYDEAVGTFEDWQAAVAAAAETADYIQLTLYHTIEDAAGEHIDENDVLAWTVENSPIPVVGTWDWSVEGGALCAEAINGVNQGKEVAKLIGIYLNGREPATISVVENVDGERMVNAAAAERWGIEVTDSLRASCTVF